MMEQAAVRAADLCRKLENAVFLNSPLDLPYPGPSMDAGLSGVPAEAMRHFATPSFPKLL